MDDRAGRGDFCIKKGHYSLKVKVVTFNLIFLFFLRSFLPSFLSYCFLAKILTIIPCLRFSSPLFFFLLITRTPITTIFLFCQQHSTLHRIIHSPPSSLSHLSSPQLLLLFLFLLSFLLGQEGGQSGEFFFFLIISN